MVRPAFLLRSYTAPGPWPPAWSLQGLGSCSQVSPDVALQPQGKDGSERLVAEPWGQGAPPFWMGPRGQSDLAPGHSWLAGRQAGRHLHGEGDNNIEHIPGTDTELEPGSVQWGWPHNRAVMTPTSHYTQMPRTGLEVSPLLL